VGIKATWWMGIVIGIVLIPIGLIIPGWKNYLQIMLRAFICVSASALIIGIIALVYGLIRYNINNFPPFDIPEGVTNPVKFAVVGNMHNLSYIGGLAGMIVGILYIIIQNLKIRGMI